MKRGTVSPKLARIAKRFEVNTQQIRAELIRELKQLVEDCVNKAKEVERKRAGRKKGRKPGLKQVQLWIRTAAYVSQVINSISKTYDLASIKAELEQLKQMIKELEKDGLAAGGKRNSKA